jgi:hypothetical protein
MDAAHELPHLRVRCGGDGTSVQDRNLALVRACGLLKPRLKQLLLQRSAIRLAGPATEIDDVKRRHAQIAIGAVDSSLALRTTPKGRQGPSQKQKLPFCDEAY